MHGQVRGLAVSRHMAKNKMASQPPLLYVASHSCSMHWFGFHTVVVSTTRAGTSGVVQYCRHAHRLHLRRRKLSIECMAILWICGVGWYFL